MKQNKGGPQFKTLLFNTEAATWSVLYIKMVAWGTFTLQLFDTELYQVDH